MTVAEMKELADKPFSALLFAMQNDKVLAVLFADMAEFISDLPLNDQNDMTGEGREIANDLLGRFSELHIDPSPRDAR